MRTILVIFTLSALIACGTEKEECDGYDNYGYGYPYDHTTPNGINYSCEGECVLTSSQIDDVWTSAQACAGESLLLPQVIFTDSAITTDILEPAEGIWNVCTNTALVQIQKQQDWTENILLHEFIHAIVYDPYHTGPWWDCARYLNSPKVDTKSIYH